MRILNINILTEKKLGEITQSNFYRGKDIGFEEGKKKGAKEERKNQRVDIIRNFTEASVRIESIKLKSIPKLSGDARVYKWWYEFEFEREFKLAIYEVKFRSVGMKESATIEMEFETPDFSMADVRRRITQVFCECKNDKGGR